jgi:hypothetical protein
LGAAMAETPARIKLIARRENRFIKGLWLLDGYHFHFGSFPNKGRRVSAPFFNTSSPWSFSEREGSQEDHQFPERLRAARCDPKKP